MRITDEDIKGRRQKLEGRIHPRELVPQELVPAPQDDLSGPQQT